MGGFTFGFNFNFKGRLTKLAQVFTYLFTNKTTTVYGTRYLVNQGDKSESGNLTTNGDFSDGLTGWIKNGNPDVTEFSDYVLFTGTGSYDTGCYQIFGTGSIGEQYVIDIEIGDVVGKVWADFERLGYSSSKQINANEKTRIYATSTKTELSIKIGLVSNHTADSFELLSCKVYPLSEAPAQDAVLHTGQGAYFNGQDNYIDTGFVPTLDGTQDYTILANKEFTGVYNNFFGVHDGKRFYLGEFNGDSIFGVQGLIINNSDSVPVGNHLVASVLQGNNVQTYVDAIAKSSGTYTSSTFASSFFIGATNNGGGYEKLNTGSTKDVYIIPKALTAQEITSHYNNPEQTLYWDNGTLKSDILDQATIDSMQAGNGLWYPLTENVSAGGYYRNHALAMPGNYLTSVSYIETGWTDNGDGSYSCNSNGDAPTSDIDFSTTTNEGDVLIVEFEIYDFVSGTLSNWTGSSTGFTASGNGYYRFEIINNYNLGRVNFNALASIGFVGSIRNIKVYPLANSGLTPLTNWSEATSTNAQQLTTGYQCALAEQDSFGLPINPIRIYVQADTLAYAQAQFTNENGLTLTDNAGTLELYK